MFELKNRYYLRIKHFIAMVENLNDSLFKEKIFDYQEGDNAPLHIKKNTIIEYWVTWCPHCQAMIPRYEKLSELFPQVDCYRVELEQFPELAKPFAVESFPTFIFISPDGNMQKWVGEVPLEQLEAMVKDNFGIEPE